MQKQQAAIMQTQALPKPLLWPQRLALLRHNLHIAHHTRDFSFFRALQVQTLLANEDHVSALAHQIEAASSSTGVTVTGRNSSISSLSSTASSSTSLDADTVIANLDKLTAVIANVHEDAFTALANHVRAAMPATAVTALLDGSSHDALPRIYAPDYEAIRISSRNEATRQRSIAAASVDKMLDAATLLISQLPPAAQHEAVAVLTLGLAFVADAVAVALAQMDRVEHCTFDPARVDAAAESVGRVVSETVLALKGMFGLMDGSGESSQQPALRLPTEEAVHHQQHHRRQKSVADQPPSLARSWVRRLSTALIGAVDSPPATPAPLASPLAWDGLRQHRIPRLPRVDSADEDVAPHDHVVNNDKLYEAPDLTEAAPRPETTSNSNKNSNKAAVDANALATLFDIAAADSSAATEASNTAPAPDNHSHSHAEQGTAVAKVHAV